MLAQQQRREELASLEARINKSITDSAEAGRREQGEAIARLRAEMTDSAAAARNEMVSGTDKTREELTRSLALSRKELSDTLGEFGQNQKTELKEVGAALENIRRTVDEKLLSGAAEHGKQHKQYDIRQREKAGAHTGNGG